MALNELSEKLDQLSVEEMGIAFDESAVWSRLEQRLDNRKAYIYWWTVAACVLLAILFLPISLLKETDTTTSALSQNVDSPVIESPVLVESPKEKIEVEKLKKPIWQLDKKSIDPIQLAQVKIKTPALEPIVFTVEKDKKPTFAGEDISIIQASLEQPKIGKGRTMTIRAQWQKSPTKSNVEHQALKVKLYEKNE